MKVELQLNQKAYTGKKGDLVYYWNPRYQCLIARKLTTHKRLSEANRRMGSTAANLRKLSPSEPFKEDLKAYLSLLHHSGFFPKLTSWYLLYIKLFYAFAARHPEWDISVLTRGEIFESSLSCRSVKSAVEDCLLPMVKGFESLTALL